MRLKKRIEETMVEVIDNIEIEDESLEMLGEIANEVVCDPKLKARIKAKVSQILEEDKLVDKMAMKIVQGLLKS